MICSKIQKLGGLNTEKFIFYRYLRTPVNPIGDYNKMNRAEEKIH